MPYRIGVYEALEAWQAGDITFRRCMRMTGVDDVAELYAAAKSSGVAIKGVSPRDQALLDRAARILGKRLDTPGVLEPSRRKQPSSLTGTTA